MNNRGELPEYLNGLGLTGKGVEVGVETGEYSDVLLRGSNLHMLFSIDSWCEYVEDDVGVKKSQIKHDADRINALDLLSKYGHRSQVFCMASTAAAKLFQPRELDFVYIDANHSFQSCRDDIEAWYPKVKPGGVLAGHDYNNAEVERAIKEFASSRCMGFEIIEEGSSTWYMEV